MFLRLAVLLIGTVVIVSIFWRLYLKVYLPLKHRRHIERIQRENNEYDKVIHPERFQRRR